MSSVASTNEESRPIWVGVDPGVTGAVGAIWVDGQTRIWDCPVNVVTVGKKSRREMDLLASVRLLEDLKKCGRVKVALEWAGAMPRDGSLGAFSYGTNFGAWKGILATLRIPFVLVRAAEWKRRIMAGREVVGKDTSRVVAEELFPDADVGRKKDAGRAESLLLAEYCRRLDLGRI